MMVIEKQIKDLFGKKEVFCESQGYNFKDFGKKQKTLENKIEWIEEFIKPLNLEMKITIKEAKI